MRKRDILAMYSSGLCELALSALGVATVWLIALKVFEKVTFVTFDASGVLLFSWQSIMLLALWPEQRFWTIRRTAPSGREHSIIGMPSDDDLRLRNQRSARRFSDSLHD
ncbi:MAG: hypothetical protein WBV62_11845 [Roseobacter sp.]